MELPLYGYQLKRNDTKEIIVNFEIWYLSGGRKYLVEKSPTWKTKADGEQGVSILHELEKPFEYGNYEMDLYVDNKIFDKKKYSIINCQMQP